MIDFEQPLSLDKDTSALGMRRVDQFNAMASEELGNVCRVDPS